MHLHIGSQITRLEPFEAAYRRGVELFTSLRADGCRCAGSISAAASACTTTTSSASRPRRLPRLVRRLTAGLDCELLFEPGRSLVAEAGVLLSSVIYLKEAAGRRFLVLDSGMHVLIRPAMYGAHHPVLPVRGAGGRTSG